MIITAMGNAMAINTKIGTRIHPRIMPSTSAVLSGPGQGIRPWSSGYKPDVLITELLQDNWRDRMELNHLRSGLQPDALPVSYCRTEQNSTRLIGHS